MSDLDEGRRKIQIACEGVHGQSELRLLPRIQQTVHEPNVILSLSVPCSPLCWFHGYVPTDRCRVSQPHVQLRRLGDILEKCFGQYRRGFNRVWQPSSDHPGADLRAHDVSECLIWGGTELANLGQCHSALVGVIGRGEEGAFDFYEIFWRSPSDDARVVP